MVTVQVTDNHEWQVSYYLEGVKCTTVISKDVKVCLDEVTHKMRMDMGHAKGKTFTNKTGNEI